jgi:CheY-like chemotaxis protein
MRVLVIDDMEGVRRFVKRALERAGHEVLLIEDGKDAAAATGQGLPDVVLTDIFMPERDGLQTIRDLRAIAPQLPIIAMSGGGSSVPGDYLFMAKKLGASVVLRKPFTVSELLAALEEATTHPSGT